MKYAGIFKLAYKLLVNDRGKFSALLLGITFAVFLMVMMTSLFAGILSRSASTVTNVGASIWVMDPAVQTVASSIPMPDYLLDAVRSIDGVHYAVPLYSGGALVKLRNGTYQAVTVMGLDDTSLVGRPRLEQGNVEDIYADNGFFVVDDAEYGKLGSPGLGQEFELNDNRGVVVGIAKVNSFGLFGIPTLYTTYSRAIEYIPSTRFTISYILVEPKSPGDIPEIKKEVAQLGYLALTKDEFDQRIADFYKYQTGIGTNIMLMTIISFIVGLSISAQTFYTFVLENLDKFGALKAIGAKGYELTYMILFQVTFTSLTGYGLGIGLCTLLIAVAKARLPDYAALVTMANLGLALGMVVLIAAVSSYISIRKVLKVEPFDIFRG
ncbi:MULTISPECIES: ABC transporter permease [unclassified Rhodanobacter]|uniref:ABC transporter permease n=1 Tax=unclassified Rhodanobacter TaxID=2621553 RepID=UPI00098481D5|nr:MULTISPECIES: ABC transporter permease [unclassified Rhodanobacter]OOG38584.1 ABC transporter permease [Rhodanobacter sp. C05]OOG50077.1 ABC transporter permease [Rhodanobacter sp. C01]OOG52265.1 ABC transporter permease [Rhodanobacter sp. C03]